MSGRDCPRCDTPMYDNGDGRWDCSVCGAEHRDPAPRRWSRADVQHRVAVVRAMARTGELALATTATSADIRPAHRPLLGPQCSGRPSCTGVRYRPCTASTCECPCHPKVGRS